MHRHKKYVHVHAAYLIGIHLRFSPLSFITPVGPKGQLCLSIDKLVRGETMCGSFCYRGRVLIVMGIDNFGMELGV